MDVRSNSITAVVRALRPRQWLKNVLVLTAPLAAGTLLQPETLIACAGAVVAFCAASSGIYLVNDSVDVHADREHPTKRHRPIASGLVSVRTAIGLATLLLVGSLALALLIRPGFFLVVLVYVLLQLAYCVWLKHIVVIDIVVVSSGFLLRAIGGATASAVVVSEWFLLVAAFGSLFMVAGKRYAEKCDQEETGANTRASLTGYTTSYLRFAWTTAAGLTLISYALWAFSLSEGDSNLLPALTVVPFGLALLRYAYDVDRGAAGAPEDTVLGDRVLIITGALWLVLFAWSVAVR